MEKVITLKLSESLAYRHVMEKQASLNSQINELYKQSQSYQKQLESLSKDVFESHGYVFTDVTNPVLNDEKTSISFNVPDEDSAEVE